MSPRDYIIRGTPVDCCLLGLEIVPSPDLIISGINEGLNIGLSRKYSGTIGAMTEGIARNIPCISISASEMVYQQFCIHTSAFSRLFVLMECYRKMTDFGTAFGLNLNIVSLRKPSVIELEKNTVRINGSLLKVQLNVNRKRFSYIYNPEIINTPLNGDLLVGLIFDSCDQTIVDEEAFIKKISEIWNDTKMFI